MLMLLLNMIFFRKWMEPMKILLVIGLVLIFCWPCAARDYDYRDWTSKDGKKTRAKLISDDGEWILFETESGETAKAPRSALSEKDLLYLETVREEAAQDKKSLIKPFQFTFKRNQPIRYTIRVNARMQMQVDTDSMKIEAGNTMQLEWVITLSADETTDLDEIPLALTTSELKGSIIKDIPRVGKEQIEIDGEHIVGYQAGVTIFDTKRGINVEKAAPYRAMLIGMLTDGSLNLRPSGHVSSIKGDTEFTKFWNKHLEEQPGFFPIVFPNHGVSIGDRWIEHHTLSSVDEVKLGEDGVEVPTLMCREKDCEMKGRRQAVFSQSFPLMLTNIKGSRLDMDKIVSINLPYFERNGSGVVLFDAERGQLTYANQQLKFKMKIKGPFFGKPADIKLKMDLNSTMERL